MVDGCAHVVRGTGQPAGLPQRLCPCVLPAEAGPSGAPVSREGSRPPVLTGKARGSAVASVPGADLVWGWAAAGGPGLSFTLGACEEEGSQASGGATVATWPLTRPSRALWPFLWASSPASLPSLLWH